MSYENPTQHYSQNEFAYGEPQPEVSKYDTQRLAINLSILTILGGVVAFAAIFLVQATIESFRGNGLPEITGAVILASIAAVVGLLFGLVYLPIDGTGNETLYKTAVIALATVAVVVYGLLGGLVQGDWDALVTLTVVISAAVIATMAPRRIEDAANY